MVIVNVHSEPDMTLRNLRERLRRTSLHLPRYPQAFGVIIGDFNICEPEEGRFSVGNQTFTEGDAGKRPCFIRSSRMLLKSRNQTLQGKIPPPMVHYSLCQSIY